MGCLCSQSIKTLRHEQLGDLGDHGGSGNREVLGDVFSQAHLGVGKEVALKWCAQENLTSVQAVLANESRLSEELSLRVLERKRLLAALGGIPNNVGFAACVACLNCAETHSREEGASLPLESIDMRVKVQAITGSAWNLTMKSSSTILAVKLRLREMDKFLAKQQFRLVIDKMELMNKWSLYQCGLAVDSVLHLILNEPTDAVLDGLVSVLDQGGLGQYVLEVHSWESSVGAVSLDELREHVERLAEDVGFENAHKDRLMRALEVEKFRAAQKINEIEAYQAAVASHEKKFQEWMVAHFLGRQQRRLLVAEEAAGHYLVCTPLCCCGVNKVRKEPRERPQIARPENLDVEVFVGCGYYLCFCCVCGAVPACSPVERRGQFLSKKLVITDSADQAIGEKAVWESYVGNTLTFWLTDYCILSRQHHQDPWGWMCDTHGIMLRPQHSSEAQRAARDLFVKTIYADCPAQHEMTTS